jgi:uncharacterized membrane protein YfcA
VSVHNADPSFLGLWGSPERGPDYFYSEYKAMIAQYFPEFNLFHLLIVCLAFTLGGFVKGISAFGLPTVAVPIMVFFVPLPTAVAIMILPMMVTNFIQMLVTGQIKSSILRHWRLYLGLFLGLPIGVYMLSALNTDNLLIGIGVMLIVIALLELSVFSFGFLGRQEKISGPVIGFISGIIGGITTLYATLPVFFFIAIGLEKEKFVAAVSVMLFSGSIFLMLSLQSMDILGLTELAYSIIGLGPLFLSMWAGTKVRHLINQTTFRKFVLIMVAMIGVTMIYRALT